MASMVTMTQKNCKWSDISSTILVAQYLESLIDIDVLILYGFQYANIIM